MVLWLLSQRACRRRPGSPLYTTMCSVILRRKLRRLTSFGRNFPNFHSFENVQVVIALAIYYTYNFPCLMQNAHRRQYDRHYPTSGRCCFRHKVECGLPPLVTNIAVPDCSREAALEPSNATISVATFGTGIAQALVSSTSYSLSMTTNVAVVSAMLTGLS